MSLKQFKASRCEWSEAFLNSWVKKSIKEDDIVIM